MFYASESMLLVLFNVLMLVSLVLQVCQLAILLFLLHRIVKDKNAAVAFVKAMWVQLQEDLMDHFCVEKKGDGSK